VKVDGTTLDITRTVDGDAATNKDRLSGGIRFKITEIVELTDSDDSNTVTLGDVAGNTLDLTAAVWTATATSSADGSFVTVVLTEDSGVVTVTFVVNRAEYTVGDKTIPANAARLFVSIKWPWESRTNKLVVNFKVIVATDLTVSIPDVSTPSEVTVTNADGVTIGRYSADTFARVATEAFDVVYSAARDTSSTDTTLKTDPTDKVYTVTAVFDVAGGPDSITYDPVISGGSDTVDVSASTSSGGSVTTSTATNNNVNGSMRVLPSVFAIVAVMLAFFAVRL